MPCMCGDTMCPSCGPAQGYDPKFDRFCEWLENDVLANFNELIDITALAEELANRLLAQPEYVKDCLWTRQREWEKWEQT